MNSNKIVLEQNNIIFGRLEDIEVSTKMALRKSKEVNDLAYETSKTKLEASVYDRQMEKLIGTMDQIQKRMLENEQESNHFGEFVLRYQPLILQNMMIESMNECLDFTALEKY